MDLKILLLIAVTVEKNHEPVEEQPGKQENWQRGNNQDSNDEQVEVQKCSIREEGIKIFNHEKNQG